MPLMTITAAAAQLATSRRTERDAATTQAVMSCAYKCKKCGAEMRMPAGRKKYEFGGWICPGCAAK